MSRGINQVEKNDLRWVIDMNGVHMMVSAIYAHRRMIGVPIPVPVRRYAPSSVMPTSPAYQC